MRYSFKIIEKQLISKVVPLVEKLNEYRISRTELEIRFLAMVEQNYECAIILDHDTIVGVCGIWYCTRHYAGKSAEVDHVYIEENHQGKGLGKAFFKWIYTHVRAKGCKTVELNTYVSNYASHKFYMNEGFQILGYHFLKKL